MIQLQHGHGQVTHWQKILQSSFSDSKELLNYLDLSPEQVQFGADASKQFPMRVPRGFAARMTKGDPLDPLFLQVWPSTAEDQISPDFVADPVGDLLAHTGSGLIHKYHGRALIITTGACAIHCRYCFRRHFPYGDKSATRDQWRPVLEKISADSSITEVILSGGDPLSLSNSRLRSLLDGVQAIQHVRRIRFHTRLPVVLPERVDEELLELLLSIKRPICMVIHANHASELDQNVGTALGKLRSIGCTLLNQAVLLRKINDREQDLLKLHAQLFEFGVLPYYLHMLDRVQGAEHFEVSEERAVQLMQNISATSPGYLVPRLVREQAGRASKTWLKW